MLQLYYNEQRRIEGGKTFYPLGDVSPVSTLGELVKQSYCHRQKYMEYRRLIKHASLDILLSTRPVSIVWSSGQSTSGRVSPNVGCPSNLNTNYSAPLLQTYNCNMAPQVLNRHLMLQQL